MWELEVGQERHWRRTQEKKKPPPEVHLMGKESCINRKEPMAFWSENYRKKRSYLARALAELSHRRGLVVWLPEVEP